MRWLIRTFFRGVRMVLGPFMLLGEVFSRPKGVERTPESQAEVDRQCRDFVIYQFPTCPFCIKVRRELSRLSLEVELRDTRRDADHRKELLRGGGQVKVPCLRIDDGTGSTHWMYESNDIVGYLRQRFAH